MKEPIIKRYVVEVKYRNFPTITISVEKNENGEYIATPEQEFFGPAQIAPWSHCSKPQKKFEDAVREALYTFTVHDSDEYNNDVVFVVDANNKYFDGNGKEVSCDDAKKIIEAYK